MKKKLDDLSGNNTSIVTALARGLELLTLFTPQTPKLTFTELYQRSALPRTTVHRLLGTLVELEYLYFDEETRRYFPGPKVMSLGFSTLLGMPFRNKARPHMVKLSRLFNESVNLAGRDNTDLVYYERIQVKQIINIDLHIGARLPLYNTALGRCLIAFLPPLEREGLINSMDATLTAVNAHGQLYKQIEFSCNHGYSLSDEEFTQGLRAVAVPVWDSNNRISAALSIAVPTFRVSVKTLKNTMVPQLHETAKTISLSLGATQDWIEGGWRNTILL